MAYQLPAPLIPNQMDALSAARQGYAIGSDMRQNQLMQSAGKLAAGGNMKGAANELMQGGQIQQGMQILDKIKADAARAKSAHLAAAAKENEILGNMAMTVKQLPPEQQAEAWGQIVSQAKANGVDVKGYEDPASIDFVVSMSGKVNDVLKNELERRKLDAKAGGIEKFGVSPMMVEDEDGNLVPVQLSSSGRAKVPDLPENFRIPGYEEKKLKEARGSTAGKTQGEARAILPATRTAVNEALKMIDELKNHPGIDTATGLSSQLDPRNYLAGTDATDFNTKNQTAMAKTFMVAREQLKGAGQVTDFEGLKGEQSITNLSTAQSKKQYLEALETLSRMMKGSYDDLKKKAGTDGQTGGRGTQPKRLRFNLETGEFE